MPPETNASPSIDHPIKVLLVDDQPIVCEAVTRMLAGETDMELRYCADPAMAVPEALKFSPTVILQDLIMPDIDGLTLVKWYRAHPKLKDIPLIVLSSREEPTTKAEAFALGANDYLVKLPDGIELIARLRYHSRAYVALLERNEAYEALTADLAQAAEYVMSLLPKPITEGTVTTEWRFIPCAQLGGDSLGYHWIDPENFAIYLLDVTGHGVGAALFSVSALEAIRTHALPGVDFRVPEDVLRAMNQFFPMQQHNDLFLTCWYGVYHLPDRRLRYSSGGHPPAILLAGAEAPQRLLTANRVIGAFPDAPFLGDCTLVKPGSYLYVYSDGVYEVDTSSGALWGIDGLAEFLQKQPRGLADLDALHSYVKSLRGHPVLDDDFSVLRVAFP